MNTPAADFVAEAIAFLRGLRSDGAWHLTPITPDGPITTRTFGPDEHEAARSFIHSNSGNRNLYVHVNRLRPGIRNIKATKADVEVVEYVHVDIDDTTALVRLRDFSLQPTAVVASGGGYNAYWRLATSLRDLDRAESINRWLVQELSGDRAATDASRILRVPGTMNLPTRKKRERGREAVMAKVVPELTDWSRTYSDDQFGLVEAAKNNPVPINGGRPSPAIAARDLPDWLNERIANVALLGDDPERPRGGSNPRYASRSEAVFAVACALARHGMTLEEIAGILLNPNLGVSASILEKSDPSGEALRQAEKAILAVGEAWPDGCQEKTSIPNRGFQNTQAAILRLGLVCRYDMFRNRMSVSGQALQEHVVDVTDKVVLMVRDLIHKRFGFDPYTEMTREALATLCGYNQFDPVCDYLDTLIWDGVPRIDTFLIDLASVEDTPYIRAVSAIFFIAAVRRARQPGVKFDTIPVLEGEQGTGKSSMLKILAGEEFFSDMDILALDQKAQIEALEGIWIYEICELAGMRFTDVNKVKAFASRSVDKARPAYGRVAELRARRGILVGTTNDDQYLRDETGNRRFWPIATGRVDLAGVKALRDQFWAEAAAREAQGESIVLPQDLWATAAAEQARRVPLDGWHDWLIDVRGWAFRGREMVTTRYLLDTVLNIPSAQNDHLKSKRLARAMKVLGWQGPMTLTLSAGRKAKGYWRPTDRPDEPYEGGI